MKKYIFMLLIYSHFHTILIAHDNENTDIQKNNDPNITQKQLTTKINIVEEAQQKIANFFVTYFIKPIDIRDRELVKTILKEGLSNVMDEARSIIVKDSIEKKTIDALQDNMNIIRLGNLRKMLLVLLGKTII